METLKVNTKPFLKWAGGKTQLLPAIDYYLPASLYKQESVTYIEPFIGGGALLFYMLRKFPNIKHAVINDLNPHLIKAYKAIRDTPYSLIEELDALQNKFRSITDYESQKKFYQSVRQSFNTIDLPDIIDASYLIFLNRTCFNGLYRENSKGHFNVPFGRYKNPKICDSELIKADSELLQQVTILHGDFEQVFDYINGYTFVYFDPPYRPLGTTSNFNSYVKKPFDDSEQTRLKKFFTKLSDIGCYIMLSNSDGEANRSEKGFFNTLYSDYIIERVEAKRAINSKATGRGKISEFLIRNYKEYQGVFN